MGLLDLINQYRNSALTLQNTVVSRDYAPKTTATGRVRVELLEALNGRVLEIHHRPHVNVDWETDLYIVRDDEALADAIATVLVLKGAK